MLTESYFVATKAVNKPNPNLSSALKDVGIYHYEFQPQNVLQHGYKKSSVKPNCLAFSDTHIFAAQADKAVINIYSRSKGNQEATVPFPERIHSIIYASSAAVLIIGTEGGNLFLWEVLSGRLVSSAASHIEAITQIALACSDEYIFSGSADSNIHTWSLSQLLSFASVSSSYNDSQTKSSPIRTFARHRGGITALATGHSRTTTNFVVSVDSELTCYLWHIETGRVLRTFLLPSLCVSIVLDPADRAVYTGYATGTIQNIDLYGNTTSPVNASVYNTTGSAPIQVSSKTNWTSPSDTGAIETLALSYDGMSLLSGHTSGKIIRWDVAKRRVLTEINDLNQPVTVLQMLPPTGLARHTSCYTNSTVTKPQAESNSESLENTVGLPASYSLFTQLTRSAIHSSQSQPTKSVLEGALFPQHMLDSAIQAITAKAAGLPNQSASKAVPATQKNDVYKIQSLEEDKELLQKKLAVMEKLYHDAQARHFARSERREKIGLQRRQAYFAAKEKGKDGDEAMRVFDSHLEAIDVESDKDELERDDMMQIDKL